MVTCDRLNCNASMAICISFMPLKSRVMSAYSRSARSFPMTLKMMVPTGTRSCSATCQDVCMPLLIF